MAEPTEQQVREEALLTAARFLVDRLDELDWSLEPDEFLSDFYGHVAPAISRLKNLTHAQ